MADSRPSLAVGRRIGTYEVLGLAGAGAMGEVYRVRDLKLQRDVALKILPATLTTDADRLARFEREARILASLNHPGIVTIHSVEEVDGLRFLTMEMVEGRPLSDLIPQGGLPVQRVLDIAVPLASALAAAHARGVVHRDLKPANVMITADGVVKILDFGIAKASEPVGDDAETALATSPHQVVGTTAYMAPEQIEGRSIDDRADLFAFGVTLFELVTGKRPFAGDSSATVSAAILKDAAPLATDIRPDLPPELARLIKRCLEKDPARRLQTALDARNELEEMRPSRPAGTATSAVQVTPRPSARTWVVAAGVLMVLAAVVAGAWRLWSGGTVSGPIDSVAVLPFVNATGNAELDYLSDGITETLTNSLTHVPEVRVVPRTLAARYRGVAVDPREAGNALRVRAVVTGQIAQRGDRLFVQAELIDVENVAQLWGDQFDRGLSEALAVQTDLASAIARGLRPRLTSEEERGLMVGTRDPVAYDLFLKGLHEFAQVDAGGMAEATELFQQAIARDPNYAAAFVQLSRVLGTRANQGHLPPGDAYPRAITAARRAIALDERLASAHAALAAAVVHFEWDWTEAQQHFERALAIAPDNAEANFLHASLFLRYRGRFDEALTHMARAEAADPLDVRIPTQAASILIQAGRHDEALPRLQRVLTLQPDFVLAHRYLATLYRLQGASSASIAESEWLVAAQDPLADSYLAQAYGAALRHSEAAALASAIAGRAEQSGGNAVIVAGTYAVLGETTRALDWLERAYKARDPMLVSIGVAREFDSIRQDPRFQDLVRRVGLPT